MNLKQGTYACFADVKMNVRMRQLADPEGKAEAEAETRAKAEAKEKALKKLNSRLGSKASSPKRNYGKQ
jgi:predicted phage gp36 major capsid-like protein